MRLLCGSESSFGNILDGCAANAQGQQQKTGLTAAQVYVHLGVLDGRMTETTDMTKSELIEALSRRQTHLAFHDVEFAVKEILEQIANALAAGDRVEIRGFGSFSLHFRPPRMGRNPKTGDSVSLPGKYVPYFKPGKELRDRVNESAAPITAESSPDDGDEGDGDSIS